MSAAATAAGGTPGRVVVVANSKGGTGKSTTSIHLAVLAARQGWKVAAVDLDRAQQTLTHSLANRARFCAARAISLPLPEIVDLRLNATTAHVVEQAIEDLRARFDIVIVDTAAGLGHGGLGALWAADQLVTPIGESLLDIDALGRTVAGKLDEPGEFAHQVWGARRRRRDRGRPLIDWAVMRNRRAPLASRATGKAVAALEALARKLAFRLLDGLSERSVLRELHDEGLTLLDLKEARLERPWTVSMVAARGELQLLARELGLRGRDLAQDLARETGEPTPRLAGAAAAVGHGSSPF